MAKIKADERDKGRTKYTCHIVPLAAAKEEADCVASVVRKGSESVLCGVSLGRTIVARATRTRRDASNDSRVM